MPDETIIAVAMAMKTDTDKIIKEALNQKSLVGEAEHAQKTQPFVFLDNLRHDRHSNESALLIITMSRDQRRSKKVPVLPKQRTKEQNHIEASLQIKIYQHNAAQSST